MSAVEGYIPVNGSAGNSAPVAGGRRHHHAKKVSAKTIRAHLRKHGLKPKGRVVLKGGDVVPEPEAEAEVATPAAGGRHRRHGGTKKKHHRRRSTSFHASIGKMFGM